MYPPELGVTQTIGVIREIGGLFFQYLTHSTKLEKNDKVPPGD